jgi:hypothetical protein
MEVFGEDIRDSRLFIHWYFTSSGNGGIFLLLLASFAKTA